MSYLKEMSGQGYNIYNIDDFHKFMIPWLLKYYGVDPGKMVVDIGAGQGHGFVPLHESGWKNIVAIDIDSYNFKMFRDRFGVESYLCDIGQQPIPLQDNSVGAILCFHLIEHLPSPSNLILECLRVLEPGGVLLLVTPDWRKQVKTFWRDPTHLRPFDKIGIGRLLRMHGFNASVHSWGSRFGLGRTRAYRVLPVLGLIGIDLLAVGRKPLC